MAAESRPSNLRNFYLCKRIVFFGNLMICHRPCFHLDKITITFFLDKFTIKEIKVPRVLNVVYVLFLVSKIRMSYVNLGQSSAEIVHYVTSRGNYCVLQILYSFTPSNIMNYYCQHNQLKCYLI